MLVQRFSQFLLSAHFTLGLMAISFVGVGSIVFSTSPVTIGPAGMLLAFGIFYVWFWALLMGLAHVLRAFWAKPQDDFGENRRTLSVRSVMLVAAWALVPLILLALQSIGQLYFASVGLVLLFGVLASIYIVRR